MHATVYHHQTEEIMTVGRSHCACGFSIYRLAFTGLQRFNSGQRSLELRTCKRDVKTRKGCGETLSVALPPTPHVRYARCEELIVQMAQQDDVPGMERARLIQDILAEMAEALREINARRKKK